METKPQPTNLEEQNEALIKQVNLVEETLARLCVVLRMESSSISELGSLTVTELRSGTVAISFSVSSPNINSSLSVRRKLRATLYS